MSTSIADVTCAEVSSERRMCSAIPRLIALIGSSDSPGACGSWLEGLAGGVTTAGAGGVAGAVGPASPALLRAGPPDSRKAWMSFLVTRPPVPVPGTWAGSIPCSDAMRATTGETNDFPFSPGATGCACATGSACTTGSAGRATGSATSVAAGSGAGAATGAAAPASPPIRASTVPTSTVAPSSTRISLTTPEAGDGTSVSTLSVEISSSVSSASIWSPTCLFHFVTVPSETETPICGITTSTAVPVAISTRSTP
jgi:hypothetical protein